MRSPVFATYSDTVHRTSRTSIPEITLRIPDRLTMTSRSNPPVPTGSGQLQAVRAGFAYRAFGVLHLVQRWTFNGSGNGAISTGVALVALDALRPFRPDPDRSNYSPVLTFRSYLADPMQIRYRLRSLITPATLVALAESPCSP